MARLIYFHGEGRDAAGNTKLSGQTKIAEEVTRKRGKVDIREQDCPLSFGFPHLVSFFSILKLPQGTFIQRYEPHHLLC